MTSTSILDRVAASAAHFAPSTPEQFLALQMSRKLGDEAVFRHYLVLFEHYAEELLLNIYHRCVDDGVPTGEHFMRLLREVTQ